MINSAMTVREVAIEVPQSTRLFEKLKIDYCCGGNRSLTEACSSAGLEVNDVLGMLATASQQETPDSSTKGLSSTPHQRSYRAYSQYSSCLHESRDGKTGVTSSESDLRTRRKSSRTTHSRRAV